MGSWLSTEIERRRREDEVQEVRRHLEYLVRTDPLTDLSNRRGVEDALAGFAQRHAQDGTSLSCVLADIDDFKTVNDTYGHATGDRVIRAVADCMREALRPGDVAGRIGGDEFLAVLPGATAGQARTVGERLADAVRDLEVMADGGGARVPVTVSIGVADVPTRVTSVTEILSRTQDVLQKSKASGKDAVTAGSFES